MSEQRYDPDVLARRLDQALPAHKKFLPPVTPDPLVNTAAEIAKLGVPTLAAQASSRIEARMLAAFDEQHPSRLVSTRSPRRARPLFQLALVASLVIVILLVGLTPAVAASLPGDPLYHVKQFYETVELSAAVTSSAKANVYVQHADRRAQEALALLERDQFDPTIISSALSNIAEAEKSASDVRASARLRGQVAQIDTTLYFVLQNAQDSGLTSSVAVAPLSQQVTQIENSALMTPLTVIAPVPSATMTTTSTLTPTPTATASPTDELTETPSPEPSLSEGDITTTCEHGKSCVSQGVPGGQVATPTPRPTNVHRNPTPTPQADPGGGNGNNGNNGNSNGNSGGNSNGGGNSAGGNSNGGNGNGGSGSGNGNGNGNGKSG